MAFPLSLKKGSVSVKIYRIKRPARKHRGAETTFTLAWHAGDTRQTKQFADLEKAKDEAALKLDQLASGRIEAAKSFSIEDAAALKGARKLAGETPLMEALKQWKAIQQLTGGHGLTAAKVWAEKQGLAYTRETLGKVIESFLETKEAAGRAISNTYKTINQLKHSPLAGQTMDTVTALGLGKWMKGRYKHPVYYNTALKRFRTLWKWSRKNGFIPKDAETVADAVDTIEENPLPIGFIRAEQLKKALRIMRDKHPHYVAPLVLAAMAGMRSKEVHSQRWEDINLEAGHLRVTVAKPRTPSHRLVPLCPAAVAWLLTCADRTEFVCGNLCIERIRDILITGGMELPDNAFRHSYITHAVADSGDIPRTALDAGNSPKQIEKHYKALVSESEGKAWLNITPQNIDAKGELIDIQKGRAAV